MNKFPPISKLFEAYSAIADERVVMSKKQAYVTSSDGTKTYTVRFQDNRYSSNDNATVWQHYAGYPIIAVLMKQGKLKVDHDLLPLFQDINWKKLNQRHNNRYDKAIDEFFDRRTCDRVKIEETMKNTLEDLKKLDVVVKGNRVKVETMRLNQE